MKEAKTLRITAVFLMIIVLTIYLLLLHSQESSSENLDSKSKNAVTVADDNSRAREKTNKDINNNSHENSDNYNRKLESIYKKYFIDRDFKYRDVSGGYYCPISGLKGAELIDITLDPRKLSWNEARELGYSYSKALAIELLIKDTIKLCKDNSQDANKYADFTFKILQRVLDRYRSEDEETIQKTADGLYKLSEYLDPNDLVPKEKLFQILVDNSLVGDKTTSEIYSSLLSWHNFGKDSKHKALDEKIIKHVLDISAIHINKDVRLWAFSEIGAKAKDIKKKNDLIVTAAIKSKAWSKQVVTECIEWLYEKKGSAKSSAVNKGIVYVYLENAITQNETVKSEAIRLVKEALVSNKDDNAVYRLVFALKGTISREYFLQELNYIMNNHASEKVRQMAKMVLESSPSRLE